MPVSNLKLLPIDGSNWRNALAIKTTPAQLKFVSDYEPVALVILSKAYVRAGGVDWYPFLITVNDLGVGLVAITHATNRCEIFHLVVDSEKQGQGLGKASVTTIVDYITKTWPECKSVTLTVHPSNDVAKSIYQACGFVATGEMRHAEPVLKLAL